MRRKAFILGAGFALSAAMAAPAAAAPLCAGTTNTVVFCVDPTGSTIVDDCVYVGAPPCRPITVRGPSFGCGGEIGQYLCA